MGENHPLFPMIRETIQGILDYRSQLELLEKPKIKREKRLEEIPIAEEEIQGEEEVLTESPIERKDEKSSLRESVEKQLARVFRIPLVAQAFPDFVATIRLTDSFEWENPNFNKANGYEEDELANHFESWEDFIEKLDKVKSGKNDKQ